MSQSKKSPGQGTDTIEERRQEQLDELEDLRPRLERVADSDLPYAEYAQRYLDALEEADR